MSWRSIVSITSGNVGANVWRSALAEEAPVEDKPRSCKGCPLRIEGEWEDGATRALADFTDDERKQFAKSWGCHESARPCAGAARIVAQLRGVA